MKKFVAILIVLIILTVSIVIFVFLSQNAEQSNTVLLNAPTEYPVTTISLTGPIADKNAELSGLAWYGDYLIMLPQYPSFFKQENNGLIFALPKVDIIAFLTGENSVPLEPIRILFVDSALPEQIQGFQGFEAIAFKGDTAFLTIEAELSQSMKGYLVSGTIQSDLSSLTLLTTALIEMETPIYVENESYETLLIADNSLITIFEANGSNINPNPTANLLSADFTTLSKISFPNIEYRVTDATSLDNNNRFWAINYFFPGSKKLASETDPLAEQFGQGITHAQYDQVERLVEFQYNQSDNQTSISLTDTPPIQLQLSSDINNWEGIVRLDDMGFLLVTDKFPETILGFVSY